MAVPAGAPATTSANLETTASLLERVRLGDAAARERLLERHLPALQCWAHGRLPATARELFETDDLVQVSLLRALEHVEGFLPRREGAFLAYLRQILLNLIRDEIRRSKARPGREPLDPELEAPAPSPLELAIGKDTLERYDRALARLPKRQRDAIFLRVELGYTHEQVGEAIGCRQNAARMLVHRAVVRLAEEMERP